MEFIANAEPVGSRTLTKRYDLGLSPATIRNEMSDLEEMGFLLRPHTSAGRVPTEKAYRFYVDQMMKTYELTKDEKAIIAGKINNTMNELDKTIKHATKLLSELTNLTSWARRHRLGGLAGHRRDAAGRSAGRGWPGINRKSNVFSYFMFKTVNIISLFKCFTI